MRLFLYLLILFSISNSHIYAQLDSTSIITEEVLDNILVEPDEETDSEELVEILEELIRNPIDINLADVFDLSKLPNMDQQSAQIIIEHRNKFGYFFSPTELFAIRELNKQLIESILPFVKTSRTNDELEKNEEVVSSSDSFLNKSKLIIRNRITNDIQNRDGFTSGKYEGSKIKSYNKFLYNYDKNYQAGFLVEKDPGEVSYTDFTSFHLQVKDIGFVKSFIAGDYVLEYGQGLALWSPYGFSKGADAVFPVKKKARYLRPYTSAAEYRFFRGAASRLSFDDFSFTAFYSNNTFDATIDSITGEITSVGQSGFHRFESELNKKGSSKSKLIGGVLDYRFLGRMNVGVIYYNASFDNRFESTTLYDFSGNNFNYVSTYYELNFSKINFFGEASYDGTSVASINGIQFSANRDLIFTTSLRNYPRNYKNLYGFGFSEKSGKINNELGIYSGLKWKIPFGVLNLYYDIFKFPYRTSENSLSSEGNELLVDFVSIPLPSFEVRLRYKYEDKEVTELINIDEEIVRRLKQIARTDLIYNISKDFRLKTRIEYNHFFIKDANLKENGLLVYQDLRYVPQKNINLYGRIIFFQTDSFNSAVYEYENDLLGVMPNLAMYGKGIRWYVIVKYKPLQFLTLSTKYSETYKPDETSLSSGDNEIIGNVDNRISFQIDMSF
ncbi:MAG: helix-hairpin-helix domain-containing protein [Ignavibacteriales bacterium]|nr:helix-hairpin-helix domain-containing protein [Ignavibacteriales bacterium]